jgi:hypothetical protein
MLRKYLGPWNLNHCRDVGCCLNRIRHLHRFQCCLGTGGGGGTGVYLDMERLLTRYSWDKHADMICFEDSNIRLKIYESILRQNVSGYWGETGNECSTFVEKRLGKYPLARLRRRWGDNMWNWESMFAISLCQQTPNATRPSCVRLRVQLNSLHNFYALLTVHKSTWSDAGW